MQIKAAIVKKLRDATGAGMMECKKALVKAEGDFDAATKILQEMGLAAVSKRADRATNNGRVFTLVTPNKAVLVELSCETDTTNAFGWTADNEPEVGVDFWYYAAPLKLNTVGFRIWKIGRASCRERV